MHVLKLTKLGNSTGLVLPPEVLNKLDRHTGDSVFLSETAHGWLLTPYDPALQDQIEAGHEFLGDFRDTFQALSE